MNSEYSNKFVQSLLQVSFIGLFAIFFLLLVPSDIFAQQVTGLGYVDTKSAFKPLASYDDPNGMVVDSSNNVSIIGDMTQDYSTTFVIPSIDLSWGNDGTAIYEGSSYFAKYSSQRALGKH